MEGRVYYSGEAKSIPHPANSNRNERFPCVHQLTSGHWADNIALKVICETGKYVALESAYFKTLNNESEFH
jgi:hypothetical protein